MESSTKGSLGGSCEGFSPGCAVFLSISRFFSMKTLFARKPKSGSKPYTTLHGVREKFSAFCHGTLVGGELGDSI